MNLIQTFSFAWFYRSFLFDCKPFHQPAKLLWGKFLCLAFRSWPTVIPIIQSFVKQQKSVFVPDKPFYPRCVSSAEKIHRFIVYIFPEITLYNLCQTVYSLSHICISGNDIYCCSAKHLRQHFNAPIIATSFSDGISDDASICSSPHTILISWLLVCVFPAISVIGTGICPHKLSLIFLNR